jgi:hypothetical protein
MHIKVRGGTVASGEPSLCAMCRYATVIKGRSLQASPGARLGTASGSGAAACDRRASCVGLDDRAPPEAEGLRGSLLPAYSTTATAFTPGGRGVPLET